MLRVQCNIPFHFRSRLAVRVLFEATLFGPAFAGCYVFFLGTCWEARRAFACYPLLTH